MNPKSSATPIILEPGKRSPEVQEFEALLRGRIVGQSEAVSELVNAYQTVLAGMTVPGRPITNLLFLGPTGSGKTHVVEAAAEILFGSPTAFIKIDCAEYQHSHEIAKLLGSPPGYLGHRETSPVLTQEALDQFHSGKLKMAFLLFDEIEKASDALWQLLLSILDKGTLTLGDSRKVDFSRTVVFMTSNLGAAEMSRISTGGIGFAPQPSERDATVLDRKIHRVATEAAKKRFSPEFMNRIDKVVVFHALSEEQLREILDIELDDVQKRILSVQQQVFFLRYSFDAKKFLLREGTDPRYGARHLKRAIERHIVFPISSFMASGQLATGDVVDISVAADGRLVFTRYPLSPDLTAGQSADASPDCNSGPRLIAAPLLENGTN